MTSTSNARGGFRFDGGVRLDRGVRLGEMELDAMNFRPGPTLLDYYQPTLPHSRQRFNYLNHILDYMSFGEGDQRNRINIEPWLNLDNMENMENNHAPVWPTQIPLTRQYNYTPRQPQYELRIETETSSEPAIDCCICLDPKETDSLCKLNCSHSFCIDCTCMHIEKNDRCPLCRTEITTVKVPSQPAYDRMQEKGTEVGVRFI